MEKLDAASKSRWKRHIAEVGITGEEQTYQSVLVALASQDVDGALYAVIAARSQRTEARTGFARAIIVKGSGRDDATAHAVATLCARRAVTEANVGLLRESIFGKAEPFSRADAWEFLNKGERLPNPLPWERLDLSPATIQEHATLSFRDEQGIDHQFRADPESALSRLWLWSRFLSTTYNWPKSQAAWYLLTGEVPTLLPASALADEGVAAPLSSIISVTVPAYGRSETAMMAFAIAKRRLFGSRRGPLALPRHAMAAFVDLECEQRSRRRDWPELWRKWNAFAPPGWRLRGRDLRYPDWRRMLDAYRRERATSAAMRRAAGGPASGRRPSRRRARGLDRQRRLRGEGHR